MRVVCEKQDLVSGLNLALRAVSGRGILPVLNGVLFDAGEDLYLQATDLEMGLKVKVPAQVDEPGKVVLPGKIIGEMARSLPGAAATLETNGENNQALLSCGDLCLKVTTYEADQFPPVGSDLEDAISYNFNADFLASVARYVAVAAAKEDSRGVFCGLLWEDAGDGRVTVVGTDTYRMAWLEATLTREPGPAVRAVIPARAILDASRVEMNDSTSVRLRLTESQAAFAFPDVTITTRLLPSSYPNFRTVIPTSFTTRIMCLGRELVGAVERAGLLAREEERKERANLVTLDVLSDKIKIGSQASQVGTLSDAVPARIEGQEGTLTFNIRYLLDGLKMHGEGDIEIKVATDFKSVIIKRVDRPDIYYMALPVQFN